MTIALALKRPVLRWHGGKWRLAPWIISHFPEHKVYVEPFGGAASVLLRKAPLPAECYNDLDSDVVNVFRVLRRRESGEELYRRIRLTPYSRDEFDWTYEPPTDEIDHAHKVIARSFMGFGSDSVSRSCRTGFRSRLSDSRAMPSQSWASYADTIDFFIERLRGVTIENRDALEVMRRLDTPETLHYLDPPYQLHLRSSLVGRSNSTHGYRHELSASDHSQMLETACSLRGMVVLSGYRCDTYDDALKGWVRIEKQALADGARPRIECLWLNPSVHSRLGISGGSRL